LDVNERFRNLPDIRVVVSESDDGESG